MLRATSHSFRRSGIGADMLVKTSRSLTKASVSFRPLGLSLFIMTILREAFFSWCRRMDYVEENPFMRVPMVRREQKVIQPFSKDDLTTLLAACDTETYVGSRMRAMILFLLDTGVRSSELVSTRLCDVVFDEGRVRVMHGKGRRQRWTAGLPFWWPGYRSPGASACSARRG